jgi:hypothetical protein
MHSIIYKYAPASFHRTWTTNTELGPTYDLRNNDELIIPHHRIELFKKLPLYSLPALWNQLDATKLQHNRTIFKNSLRDKLFTELQA